jgi:hypothetical protein
MDPVIAMAKTALWAVILFFEKRENRAGFSKGGLIRRGHSPSSASIVKEGEELVQIWPSN